MARYRSLIRAQQPAISFEVKQIAARAGVSDLLSLLEWNMGYTLKLSSECSRDFLGLYGSLEALASVLRRKTDEALWLGRITMEHKLAMEKELDRVILETRGMVSKNLEEFCGLKYRESD